MGVGRCEGGREEGLRTCAGGRGVSSRPWGVEQGAATYMEADELEEVQEGGDGQTLKEAVVVGSLFEVTEEGSSSPASVHQHRHPSS